MTKLDDQFELRLATETDAEQILNIYECEEFEGRISVLYTRRPNPYLSLLHEGERVIMPVIVDCQAGIICAVGCCVIRKAYVQGQIKNTGYLTGLKILPEYRKRLPYIAKVYQYLYDETKKMVDHYYTTILIDNLPVQKMLEKRRKNMPVYDLQGIYTVYCFKTGSNSKVLPYRLECGNVDQVIGFYQEQAKNWDLFNASYTYNPDNFDKDTIYSLYNEKNEMIAACIILNQQDYKQYIIKNYGGIYRRLQHLPMKWLGYPNFPRIGQAANYACYHMLCVRDNDLEVAEYFIKLIAHHETRYDFLMLGLFENHPFTSILTKMKTIKYRSKLYFLKWNDRRQAYMNEVGYDDEKEQIHGNRLHIDVGLL